MKYIYLLLILFLISFQAHSQDFKRFSDEVILLADSCKAIIVDMGTGVLKVEEGDIFTAKCELKDDLNISCSYTDSKNKVYAKRDLVGGISGSEGAILSDSDKFLVNAVTKKFYSEANINLADNRIRGKKICSGDWLYKKELANLKIKK